MITEFWPGWACGHSISEKSTRTWSLFPPLVMSTEPPEVGVYVRVVPPSPFPEPCDVIVAMALETENVPAGVVDVSGGGSSVTVRVNGPCDTVVLPKASMTTAVPCAPAGGASPASAPATMVTETTQQTRRLNLEETSRLNVLNSRRARTNPPAKGRVRSAGEPGRQEGPLSRRSPVAYQALRWPGRMRCCLPLSTFGPPWGTARQPGHSGGYHTVGRSGQAHDIGYLAPLLRIVGERPLPDQEKPRHLW